jgi:hypothetical protein
MHYRQKRYVLPHTPFDQGCLFGGLQYVSTGLGAETSVHCGVLPANEHFLRADERTRTAYPCSLRVCMRTFYPVPLRPVFSLFMRVSVDRGRRFVHCVLVCISPVAVWVAVFAWSG